METTFDRFIGNNPKEKKLFDSEYADFALTEFLLEQIEKAKMSADTLARKAGVSSAAIRKINNKTTENLNYRVFSRVLNTLGYRFTIEKLYEQ